MPHSWKKEITDLTELPAAKAGKIDASFFPPVEEGKIEVWEIANSQAIPEEIRSYIKRSNGLEAQRGEICPFIPFSQWTLIDDACACGEPMVRFGEAEEYFYHVSLGHPPSIYRSERLCRRFTFCDCSRGNASGLHPRSSGSDRATVDRLWPIFNKDGLFFTIQPTGWPE